MTLKVDKQAPPPPPISARGVRGVFNKTAFVASSIILVLAGAAIYFTAGNYPIGFFVAVGVASVSGGTAFAFLIINIVDWVKLKSRPRTQPQPQLPVSSRENTWEEITDESFAPPSQATTPKEYWRRLKHFKGGKLQPTFLFQDEVDRNVEKCEGQFSLDFPRNLHFVKKRMVGLKALQEEGCVGILSADKYQNYRNTFAEEVNHLLKSCGYSKKKRKELVRKICVAEKSTPDPENLKQYIIQELGLTKILANEKIREIKAKRVKEKRIAKNLKTPEQTPVKRSKMVKIKIKALEEIMERVEDYRMHALHNSIFTLTGRDDAKTAKIIAMMQQQSFLEVCGVINANLMNFDLGLVCSQTTALPFNSMGYNIKKKKGQLVVEAHMHLKISPTDDDKKVFKYLLLVVKRDVETEMIDYKLIDLGAEELQSNIYVEKYCELSEYEPSD